MIGYQAECSFSNKELELIESVIIACLNYNEGRKAITYIEIFDVVKRGLTLVGDFGDFRKNLSAAIKEGRLPKFVTKAGRNGGIGLK